jgi:DNA-binding MarR family transcriptional regulator
MAPSASVPTLAEYQETAELRAALRAFLRRGEQVARAHGLTPQRHLLLLMIKGAEDGSQQATVGDLVRRLALAQSAVTELIDRCAEAGLVERAASPGDGRVVLVRLTSEGERRLAETVGAMRAERATLREVMTHDRRGNGD